MEGLVVFIFGTLIFSAFLKGSLGMGFSSISLAILANVIELKTAISIVVLPSLISNVMVMVSAGQWRISIQMFWTMLVMAVPGMILGLQLLRRPDNQLSVLILAAVLIGYGAWGLFNHRFRLPNTVIARLNPLVGFLTGCVNGATGSQLLPIMPYLLSLNISKEVMVLTINLSFTLCSLIMLAGLTTMGTLDTQSMATYALGILPVMAGVWLGNRVRDKLTDDRFRQLAMSLIIVLGALLLWR